MDTSDKTFIWTSERTEKLFKLRFENDWLFKRKKQPWKEFRDILLKNGFPEEMTLDQIRKKWSYTYDCFRLAKRTRNKKWIYYKLFDKHFRKNKVLDKYESWNEEWRHTLISSIMLVIDAETGNIDWRLVENQLRVQNLPSDCCIQDMKGLWHHLKVTFHRKYRLNLKKGEESSQWPQYEDILNYYETHEPDYLVELAKENVATIKNKKVTSKRIKMEDENNEYEGFHWTKDITESFIQIRLQHEWLFREKKWAWNDLAAIMYTDFGFPTYLTGRMMCHKWGSTYSDYQKAKATGNVNWLYYNLFEAYLNEERTHFDPLNNWSEEWINKLIVIRTELEGLFGSAMKPPHLAWREVEKRLRSEKLPIDHSLLNLSEMWMKLFKTFKWKRKFDRKGILNVKWPYYENMMRYSAARQIQCKKEEKQAENLIPDTSLNDDFDDDIVLYDLKKMIDNDVKVEIIDNMCRACCKEDGSVNLFEVIDENGLDLAAKLKVIAGVEIEKVDSYPNEICSKCLKELESAYNFRKKCQVTDSKLRNMKVNDVKIEISINEDSTDLQIDERVDNFNDGAFDDNIEDLFKDSKVAIKKVQNNKTRKKYKNKYDYSRVCEVCGKSTKNIKNHMDSHATDKMYDCEQCGKKFKFKSGLVIHKAVHNPVPRKTCEVCGKAFHILAQYRKHFVYHINERKFSCESCGKSFHTKEILTVHTRTHTDERPFSCPDCGKTFRTAGCVSRHRRIVHKRISKG